MTINERWARAFLTHLAEPGDEQVGALVREYGPAGTLDYLYHAKFDRVAERLSPRWPRDLTLDQLEHWYVATLTSPRHTPGVTFLVPGDAKWPTRLNNLGDAAPHGLWVRGDAQALAEMDKLPSVALVGARAATNYGEHVAMELASELAKTGVIVSGGAYGIDGAAHRATLAMGGLTVAFMAGGVDRFYPAGHNQLLERVTAAGAVASEVPPGSAPTKWRFLQRNRLIAAAAAATVVVEAGFRSGSINTAGHAVALRRPLGAVPGSINSAASAGTHRMIREMGATLITSAEDVRQLLGQATPSPRLAVIDEEV